MSSDSEIVYITNGDKVLAMIVPAEFQTQGIGFFTPDSYSQQLAQRSVFSRPQP